MEFRFAATQLRLPLIVAAVGTRNMWETTEVEQSFHVAYSCEIQRQFEDRITKAVELDQDYHSQADSQTDLYPHKKYHFVGATESVWVKAQLTLPLNCQWGWRACVHCTASEAVQWENIC